MRKKIRPIILAGGIGKRLLPLSTKSNPKQFIPIFKDLSLFDLTLQRVNNNLFKKPIVVTSKDYLNKVLESLERTGIESKIVILEPESKNTLAAITSAVYLQSKNTENENFIVLPSDHYVSINKKFLEACKNAFKGLNQDNLVLFGVKPRYPSTEFGYIKSSKEIPEKVDYFIEKPDSIKAKNLFKSEQVLWNSGIFLFKGKWYLRELKNINSNFLKKIIFSVEKGKQDGISFSLSKKAFKEIESLSFDKSFTEKCRNISMLILEAGWSDLGSWFSLGSLESIRDSSYSLFQNELNSKIERPWGYFKVLMETNFSKVKLIKVYPNQKLSLQKHKHRSETWYVIKGRAKVTRSKEKFTLELGDSISIDKNQIHSLENIDDTPLEIIEIQAGNYLGEDDIVRIEDIYGRADLH